MIVNNKIKYLAERYCIFKIIISQLHQMDGYINKFILNPGFNQTK